jgi:type I restriction enzyme M protein
VLRLGRHVRPEPRSFVEAHGGKPHDLAVYGQEWNATTWRLCRMNLAIRGIEADLGKSWGNSFHDDQHKRAFKADFILANPPVQRERLGRRAPQADDVRWAYGTPARGQRQLRVAPAHRLAPRPEQRRGGRGARQRLDVVAAVERGRAIRKEMVEADLVDCMVALPGQLFYVTQIPVCLWFLAQEQGRRALSQPAGGQVLFIDARKMGALVDRTHRELSDERSPSIAAHLPRVARREGRREVRGRRRLLQERHARGGPRAHDHRAHAGPLRVAPRTSRRTASPSRRR